ncbi:MAG: hypothetical protein HY822_09685 [Acidobacteria bacterium]|nr:hypothetical protein [Acidobacteriota bacterium]
MSAHTDPSRLSLREFAERFQDQMVPLTNTFSYFALAVVLGEDDVREYLDEPIAALPPAIAAALPKVSLVLAPHVERANGKEKTAPDYISVDKPAEGRSRFSTALDLAGKAVLLAFGIKDQDVADYHYSFYQEVAELMAGRWSEEQQSQYFSLLREELSANIHGEVDEASWHLKQALLRRQTNVRRETKAFREYARQSFVDTLTLYLHGICCDIDVDTGPRQLPSRCLRRRLVLVESLFPPPTGYAVFPEELGSPPPDSHA